MKLHIVSDLHLSQAGLALPDTGADVVILAGDVARPEQVGPIAVVDVVLRGGDAAGARGLERPHRRDADVLVLVVDAAMLWPATRTSWRSRS